ncbi:hypothetical protein BH20CHL4_BH20CHL4_14740 [soil metagenome]
MKRRALNRLGLTIFALAFTVLQFGPAHAAVQPSFDTIRVQDGDVARLYQASILWTPLVLPLPDGSAWSFFTAQLKLPTEPGADPTLSNFKVFASRFDPASATWSPATALPGEISFGPTGVVDSQGTVHLVYTIRANLDPASFGSMVYIKTTPEGGWTGPTLVAASETAGHQLSPDLAIDANDGLHIAWQDQRSVTDEQRAADASNADVFVSDLNPDGTWSEPVQLSERTAESVSNSSRPKLLADGERLVAVWSIYSPEIGLESATHIEWSTRPVSDAAGWGEPQMMFDQGETLIGGRFLDAEANAGGDIAVVYGRRTATENQLYLQRLPSGTSEWSEPSLIAAGNRGSYPNIALGGDGALYIVYNLVDSGLSVQVGAISVAPGETSAGAEVALTIGEEGQQGIAAVSVGATGRVWVMYLHELPGKPSPTEARVLRGALVESLPVVAVEAEIPAAATPEAEATPEG